LELLDGSLALGACGVPVAFGDDAVYAQEGLKEELRDARALFGKGRSRLGIEACEDVLMGGEKRGADGGEFCLDGRDLGRLCVPGRGDGVCGVWHDGDGRVGAEMVETDCRN